MSMKQIKISEEIYNELKELMFDKETFNLVIQRILKENQTLREDKDKLMKIAMKTEDSIAFPNVNHTTIFSLIQVLKDTHYSDDEKLGYLKIYLKPSLEVDAKQVLVNVDDFKSEYDIEGDVLDKLTSWIKEEY